MQFLTHWEQAQAEAAGGFGLGRGVGETQLHFGVRLGRPRRQAEVGHRLAGGDLGARGIHDEVGAAAGQGRQLLGQRLPLEGAVDGQGGPAAGGKGLHRALGPGDQVAPGKDPRNLGRQRHRVRLQPEDGGGVKGQAGPEKAEIRGLAHRRDHRVHLQGELGAGHRHRARAAAGVGLSQLGLLGHQSPDPAVSQQAHRQGEEMELNAFPAGLLHLRGQGRHEVSGAAIEEVHFLGPGPPGGAGRVHRGVAAADDGHPAAHCRGRPLR